MINRNIDPKCLPISATIDLTTTGYFTNYYQICVRNKYALQMAKLCHIYQLLHVHIQDNCVSIYTS